MPSLPGSPGATARAPAAFRALGVPLLPLLDPPGLLLLQLDLLLSLTRRFLFSFDFFSFTRPSFFPLIRSFS